MRGLRVHESDRLGTMQRQQQGKAARGLYVQVPAGI
nr:MAG TPA: hypothetical protein [Caudoviricetes sp.]